MAQRCRSSRPASAARRIRALLPMLLLPACAALPPVEARHAADTPGPVCSAQHRLVVDEALGVARTRAAEALHLLRTQPEHPHVRRWFGTAPRPALEASFARTAAALDRPEMVKVVCNDPPACRLPQMAYVSPRLGILGLCPGFFLAPMEGFDTRWGTLIHEMSHVVAGTQDHAYGPQASLSLAKGDPLRAAANADNHEYFAETLPR